MRRKLFIIFASALFVLGVAHATVFAQELQTIEPAILPPNPRGEPGFLGQDHNYSLVFRGNGEAVVSLKVILTNKSDGELTKIALTVPGIELEDFSAYQVIRDPVCIRYDPQIYSTCLEYGEPDYYSYYGNAKYQKSSTNFQEGVLTITLPQPIVTEKTGSYFVYFRTSGFVDKDFFGAFKYHFETLKADDDIRTLNIGIDTDSELKLKGAKGEVNYRFDTASLSGVSALAPESSASIDSFYNQIGYGVIVKNTSNLAPLESYMVNGSYAKNNLILYGKEISIGIFVLIALIVITLSILKIIISRLKNRGGDLDSKSLQTGTMIGVSAGVGFVSSLFTALYTGIIIFLSSYLTNALSYRYNSVVVLFLILISFAIYSLLLFGPGIYLGVRKGLPWGVATVVLTIAWLIVFLGITVLVIFLIGDSGSATGPVYPLSERAT